MHEIHLNLKNNFLKNAFLIFLVSASSLQLIRAMSEENSNPSTQQRTVMKEGE